MAAAAQQRVVRTLYRNIFRFCKVVAQSAPLMCLSCSERAFCMFASRAVVKIAPHSVVF